MSACEVWHTSSVDVRSRELGLDTQYKGKGGQCVSLASHLVNEDGDEYPVCAVHLQAWITLDRATSVTPIGPHIIVESELGRLIA